MADNYQISNLEVNVTSNAQKAAEALNRLADSLGKLKGLQNIDLSNTVTQCAKISTISFEKFVGEAERAAAAVGKLSNAFAGSKMLDSSGNGASKAAKAQADGASKAVKAQANDAEKLKKEIVAVDSLIEKLKKTDIGFGTFKNAVEMREGLAKNGNMGGYQTITAEFEDEFKKYDTLIAKRKELADRLNAPISIPSEKISASAEQAAAPLGKIIDKIADVGNEAEKASEPIGKIGEAAQETARVTKEALDQMEKNLEMTFEGFKTSSETYKSASLLAFEQTAKGFTKYGNYFNPKDSGELLKTLSSFGDRIGSIFTSVKSKIRGVNLPVIQFGDTLKTAFQKGAVAAKKMLSIIGKFGEATGNLFLKTTGIDKLINGTTRLGSAFHKLETRLASLIRYRVLSSVIRSVTESASTGFSNLQQASSSAYRAMKELSAVGSYVGNSLAAALMPAIKAVIPLLQTLASWAVTAFNAINMFFTMLAGKTSYTRAVKVNADYASSLKGVGGAAKEATKQLMAFDELNVLKGDSSSGGGGGSSGISASDMFETAEIANSLKDAWENGDFTSIFAEFGEKIANWLDQIDWTEIEDFGKKIASSIATAINGFFLGDGLSTGLRPESVGQAIAGVINTATGFIATFTDKTKWRELGQWVGNTLNTAIQKIDKQELIQSLTAKLRAATASAIGFLDTTNWNEVGKLIGEVVTGWFDALNDLPELGTSIGTALAELLNGINISADDVSDAAENVATSLVNAMSAFVDNDGLTKLLVLFVNIASGIIDGIGKALSKADFAAFWSNLAEAMKTAWDEASFAAKMVFLGTAIAKILGTKIGASIWGSILGTGSTTAAASGGTGVLGGLATFINGLLSSAAQFVTFGVMFDGAMSLLNSGVDKILEWLGIDLRSDREKELDNNLSNAQERLDAAYESYKNRASNVNGKEVVPNQSKYQTATAQSLLSLMGSTGTLVSKSGVSSAQLSSYSKLADKLREVSAAGREGEKTLSDLGITIDKFPELKELGIDVESTSAQNALTLVEQKMKQLNGTKANLSVNVNGDASGLLNSVNSALTEMANKINNLKNTKLTTTSTISGRVMADGGVLDKGTVFVAGEAGNEIVGKIGNQTGVMNDQQIDKVIADKMNKYSTGGSTVSAESIGNAVANALVRAGVGAVYLDGKQLTQSMNRNTMRSGRVSLAL